MTELATAPQPDIGAPMPVVLGTDGRLYLAYFVRSADTESSPPVAIVTFEWPYAHMFGAPNDEAFVGHPLAARGLKRYAVSEVTSSSWIRQLERVDSVHPGHRPDVFAKFHHYVFAFHDTTFECVARSFKSEVREMSLEEAVKLILQRLWD